MQRRDTPVTQSRVDELNMVRGWIEPVFVREDPVTGEQHRLITAEDGARIAAGYACGECGAVYDIVMAACAVCSRPIGLELAPMRPEWETKLAERRGELTDAPVASNPFSPDEFFRRVAADPEIEQRRL